MALDDTARPIAAIIADMRLLLAELEAAPVLGPLTITAGNLQVGTLATMAIVGATDGSTITGVVPDGMTLISEDRVIVGRPTAAGGTSIVLDEALAGARESPRRSTIEVTIAAKPIAPTPTRVTLGNSKIRMGNRAIRMNGVGGTGETTPTPQPIQNFSFGPAIGQPGEGSTAVQNFSFGPVIGSPGEGATVVQNFSFAPATSAASE